MSTAGEALDASAILSAVPAFEQRQLERCAELGIDARRYPLSHVAYRCPTWHEYLLVRAALEEVAVANLENVWNGRPISKIVLEQPVPVSHGRSVDLVELIPPFHQRVYRMGLEHVGYVVGPDRFEDFAAQHRGALTGQQFQSPVCRPVYRLFDDYTHVKFYERGLQDVCELEGASFTGFTHADWHPRDATAGPYEVS